MQIQQLIRDVQWLNDMVRSHRPTSSPTVQVRQESFGTTFHTTLSFSKPTFKLSTFQVHAVQRDTLICRDYSYNPDAIEAERETVGTSDITIAKPLDLQPDTYNGKTIEGITYTEIANGGPYNWRKGVYVGSPSASGAKPVDADIVDDYPPGTIVYEKIWMPYVPDSTIILAAKCSGLRADCDWIELSQRRWKRGDRSIAICVTDENGVATNKLVLIEASVPF